MTKKKIRSIALILASVMLVSTGCGQKAAQQDSQSQASSKTQEASKSSAAGESAGGTEQAAEERATLTIGVKQSSNIVDYETNFYTSYIEEIANVDLEFVIMPSDSSEYVQKLTLMISGGSELPDIVLSGPSDVLTYGEAGIFVPIEDYLSDPEAMPIFHENVPEDVRELMFATNRQLDGHIYSGSNYVPEFSNEVSYKAFINQTWLDKLNLEVPTTTDDLYNVLKAFKEQDPNGNGEADEIPMVGTTSGSASPIAFLMNAFIYTDPKHNYLYVEDGEIKASFTDERFKEGLTYINKLVSEGLLSSLSFTQDNNQFKALANNEEQLIGCFTRTSVSCYSSDSENVKDMYLLAPLTGPDGANWATYNKAIPSASFFITKDCENVDAAIRLLDACYDPVVGMINRYGEINVDWSPEVTDTMVTVSGMEPGWMMIQNVWGTTQNSHWEGAMPRYVDPDGPYSVEAQGIEPEDMNHEQTEIKPVLKSYYENKHPEELIIGLTYSLEETTEATDLTTAISTYVEQSIVQFAVGELPLSDWDDYLDTLNDMGLERYLELVQSAYDRYNE